MEEFSLLNNKVGTSCSFFSCLLILKDSSSQESRKVGVLGRILLQFFGLAESSCSQVRDLCVCSQAARSLRTVEVESECLTFTDGFTSPKWH